MRGGKLLRSLQYNDLFVYGFQPLLFWVLAFENFLTMEIHNKNIPVPHINLISAVTCTAVQLCV